MGLFITIKFIAVTAYLWVVFDLVYSLSHGARSVFYGTVAAAIALFYPKSLMKRLLSHIS